VRGTQSALVVGKAGEEIWTDPQGRVKLHFYWDRQSRKDENSSCWVRCSTAWAGRGWGQFSVPRIGQEVLVDFLEGDPDRPVVVGRVYNAEQPPPCNPGGGGVISGMRTKTHKGTGYNAIEMDDTAGAELVSVHAQYDMDTAVEHDERVTVGNNRTESVGKDESITIGNDRTESVAKNETLSVGENQSLSVGKEQTITVGASQSISVGKDQVTTVAKNQSVDVGESRSLSVGKDESIDVNGRRTVQIGKDDSLQVAKSLVIDAGDQIVIKTGDASITMKSDGTITIKGADIKVQGSGKVNVKADSDVVIKGSKVMAN
jgi:type VI secretion system secreted protein VgrG